jgi:NAD(P)-dependent dehydrogenase (short-subunit alcohol dehydrogenase family)
LSVDQPNTGYSAVEDQFLTRGVCRWIGEINDSGCHFACTYETAERLTGLQTGKCVRWIVALIDETSHPGPIHRAGIDTVDAYSPPGLVGGHGLCEAQYRPLGCRVNGSLNQADIRCNRAHIDDGTRPRVSHEWKHRRAEKRQSEHIDREYSFPVVGGSIDHIPDRSDPSVIAEHVDATVLVVDAVCGGMAGRRIADVEIPLDVETNHHVAVALERFDEGRTDATGCAGNNDDSGDCWRDHNGSQDSNREIPAGSFAHNLARPTHLPDSMQPGTMTGLMSESGEPVAQAEPRGTAIVTGAGGGLGRAIALRLAQDGFSIASVDVDHQACIETARLVHQAGGTANSYLVDLRDREAVERSLHRAKSELGPAKALVNNAAVFPSGPFLEATIEDYDNVVAINQRAYFLVAQIAARSMRDSGGGAIVNMGSITEHGGWDDVAAYVVTKGAASALTRALATELGRYNIRVNCVAPGAFPTRAEEVHPDADAYKARIIDSQALKRRGTFSELAGTVSFLLGPDASFITGQTLNVDGGWIMS